MMIHSIRGVGGGGLCRAALSRRSSQRRLCFGVAVILLATRWFCSASPLRRSVKARQLSSINPGLKRLPAQRPSALRPFEPVGQLMPFASQPTPKHHHYEVAGFVRAFFASSRFCATIFWVQHFCRLLFYDFITTSPADTSVIQCRFVVTRRCRVQARPKNGHRSGGGNKKTRR